jgi:hypothetical protein
VGCAPAASAGTPAPEPTPPPGAALAPSTEPPIQDVSALKLFASLEPGAYSIDPDGDRSTPLRIVYEISAEGWSGWLGAAKFADEGAVCTADGCQGKPAHVAMSITTVKNLVTDGCRDHAWADPPVGQSVDDLATALADLAPFQVTSPPTDVTIYGYGGKHLAWTVPDLSVTRAGDSQLFSGCLDGSLKSWVSFIDAAEPGDAFYGYDGPDYTEEFWILDVEGTRLMIAAERSADSPAEDVAELQAILHSIRIEP